MSVIGWLMGSNRWKHLVGGFVLGLLLTFVSSLTAAATMEFKDCHHYKGNASKPLREWDWGAWDWADFSCTVLGGLLATGLQIVAWLVLK